MVLQLFHFTKDTIWRDPVPKGNELFSSSVIFISRTQIMIFKIPERKASLFIDEILCLELSGFLSKAEEDPNISGAEQGDQEIEKTP